jgi:MFS family permease
MATLLRRFHVEIGLQALLNSPLDTKILCLQRLVRLSAYGATTVILALYLSSLGIADQKIGLFMTLTLLGDVVISLILTSVADAIGRRRMLGLGSLLMAGSGVVFATCSGYWILVTASVLGVISPR